MQSSAIESAEELRLRDIEDRLVEVEALLDNVVKNLILLTRESIPTKSIIMP